MTTEYFRGVSRRTALRRALDLYHYDRTRAEAALVSLGDGTYAVRRRIPFGRIATIPMPIRERDLCVLVGWRGIEQQED